MSLKKVAALCAAAGINRVWTRIMSNESKPATQVTIEKLRNGRWGFVLKRGPVVYPAQGQFASQMEAVAAGQAVLKSLEKKR